MGWVALIPLLPALSFAVLVGMSNRVRNASVWVSLGAIFGSLLLSFAAFAKVWPGGEEPVWSAVFEAANIGGHPLELGLQLDALTAAMLLVVTIVGACVQVYSLDYMKKDPRKGWYFTVLSLFTAAMLTLVLAGDFLLLYMSWEVMGLCSFLLIGFWHEQAAPRAASLKAFLTTRVGDLGFAIGLAIIWATTHTFNIREVAEFHWSAVPVAAAAATLLLFFGAMGKSAQVPLHVWLPDAMAGPTPASALIHAATMVAAGVYLVIREMPIFLEAAAGQLQVVMAIGVTTALVGGMIAVVQYDIKKVLAYSTISQLGFMFIALGTGNAVAAVFHLVTHAFFKSLLFLASGAVIHATHTQDMREMGGLRRAMPWTTTVYTIGALALAGVPGLSGFFSKDEILVSIFHAKELYSLEVRWVLIGLTLAAAGLTAFYMTRLWIRVFAGDVSSHAKEGHLTTLLPMTLLAIITVFIGWTQPVFMIFLGEHGAWPDPLMASLSLVVFVLSVGGGWLVYSRQVIDRDRLKTRFSNLYGALDNKLYFDIAYDAVFIRPFFAVADWLSAFDARRVDGLVNGVVGVYVRAAGLLNIVDARVIDGVVNGTASAWVGFSEVMYRVADVRIIDGTVNGVATFVKWSGARIRKMQVGRVQIYQRLAYAGLFAIFVVIALSAWLADVLLPMLRGV